MGNYTRQPWPQETVDLWRERLTKWCSDMGFVRVNYAVDACIEELPELKGIADVRSRVPDRPSQARAMVIPPGETLESMRANYLEFVEILKKAAKKSKVS